jgi:hypothetical protein
LDEDDLLLLGVFFDDEIDGKMSEVLGNGS